MKSRLPFRYSTGGLLALAAAAAVLILVWITTSRGTTGGDGEGNDGFLLIPEDSGLELLSFQELSSLFHSYLENQQYLCRRKKRYGNYEDGGWYVCVDQDYSPRLPCLVYSFGINWDFSFDDDISKAFLCEVHSFDPSMNISSQRRSALVHFHALGIAGQSRSEVRAGKTWNMRTLADLRRQLGHAQRSIEVMKMDVEFSEWEALEEMLATDQLTTVRQMALEFHTSYFPGRPQKGRIPEPDAGSYVRFLRVLRGLYEAGHRIYWTETDHNCDCTSPRRTACYEAYFVNTRFLA